ncbi:MAG: glycosyltransferase family 4 protein [Patescibacteria group bacterium]|nr:glycosyltransferase family 4 protein [Patescibacteria group bacterium]
MRVLLITNHLDGTDGWSRYGLDLYNELKRRGLEVDCECFDDPMSYLCDASASKAAALRLQSAVDRFKPDIVHIVVEPLQSLLPFIELPDKVRVVATIHGTYSFTPALFRDPMKKIMASLTYWKVAKEIDRFISVSSYTKEKLHEHWLAKLSGAYGKTVVVDNAIDLSAIRSNDRSHQKRILFVGAIKPRKGIGNLLKAFDLYARKYGPDAALDIVGSGDTSSIPIGPSIKVHGRVSDEALDRLYSTAGVFVLLAIPDRKTFEGFGLVYLEANARGVPTIGSRDSGARDAIVHGKTGYLVDDPNDPEECARYLQMILDEKAIDPDDCREWAQQHDIKIAAEKIIRLYQGR